MDKEWRHQLLPFVLVLAFFFCTAAYAGTTYTVEYKHGRGTYVAYDEEHQPIAELPCQGIGIDLNIAGNAKYLYYDMVFADEAGGTQNVLYRYTIKTGNLKKLKKLPGEYETFAVMFLVGDTLFLTGRMARPRPGPMLILSLPRS